MRGPEPINTASSSAMPGRRRRIGRAALAAALLLTLAACGTAAPVPSDHYYRLDVTTPAPLSQPKLDGIVEVERFAADGVTADRAIAYAGSVNSLELKAYHYHFWTESPTVMLRDALIKTLRAGHVADQVVTPEDRVTPDYVITGEIKQMERVVGSQPGKALLSVDLVLRHAQDGKLLLLRSYRVVRDVSGGDMGDFVAAMNSAASEAFAHFVADLAKL